MSTIITKKTLDNKSRKGDYFYIRSPGKKGRYAKIIPGMPEDMYVYAYEEGISQREVIKSAPLFTSQKKFSKKKIQLLKKGISEVTSSVEELTDFNNRNIVLKRLLKPLLTDKKNEKLILQNSHLIRGRFSYTLTAEGTTEGVKEQLLTVKDIGTKNLTEFANIYGNKLKIHRGMSVSNQEELSQHISQIARIPESNVFVSQTGKIIDSTTVRIQLTI